MSGYVSKTSWAALIRFSAGLAPAMPAIMTMLPLPFRVSAIHCAMWRPNDQSSALTKER